MSSCVDHYLKYDGLHKMLMEAGVISSRVMHGTRGREVQIPNALDMSKCCPEEYEKVKASAIEYGVVDFSKKNEDGKHGVRRDLTDEEIEELKYWPIVFHNENEVEWVCKWKCNDNPAFFISKLFPDKTFEYIMFYEGETDGIFTIKDGVFTPTAEWEEMLKQIRTEKEVEQTAELIDEDTLPF